ncbi:MAG: C45 family peptidase [Clostridia bacterium]|nr:C45 family peptidase [Clostridia bacterium]
MYHARFKGSHYEAGFRYGSCLNKNGITLNQCPTFPIDEKRIKFGKECLKIYKELYPEIVEEIKGLAEGNETSFEFLFTMLSTMYCFNVDNRCSCFAFKDKDNIIFGRNSDFLVSIEKYYMNVLYNLNDSYAFNGNTTAFIEIEDGVNEHGLAIGLTFIAIDKVKPGLNAGILLRYLLEKCKTVDEAINQLKILPIASAQTITMADSTGNMVVVECNSEKIEIVQPENNFVCATNIFHTESMKKYNLKDFDNWRADERFQTMQKAFEKANFSLNLANEVLSGKHGFICQYNRKENSDTVWSVIYDLKNKKIFRVEGNPGRKPFKEDTRFKFKE